ncbi:MAG: hypothetical protein Q7S42_06510 [Candidatus Omnitrophota bacterium]|nr:hypothetical protein [Candidatus Omnitrophota bacterium]
MEIFCLYDVIIGAIVIKSIVPRYNTGFFRIDVIDVLESFIFEVIEKLRRICYI